MANQTITVDFNANLARFSSSIDRATADLNRFQTNASRISGQIKSAFGAMAGVVSVGALAGFIKQSIDAADRMRDLAIATGTSVKSLASYELAAEQSGTSIESLAKAMGRLSIYMANNSAEAQALGLSARDPAEALTQFADVLAAVEDPIQRNALAARVLGKSYQEVVPLLAQGGEELRRQANDAGPYAERMAKLAEEADKFNDALGAIGQSARAALIPLVEYIATVGNSAIQAAKGLDGMSAAAAGLGQLGVVGQTIGVLWANVAYVFEQVGKEIGGIAAQIVALGSGDFQGAGAIGRMMKEDAKKARAELDALEDRILNFRANAGKSTDQGKTAGGGSPLSVASFIDDGDADKLQANLRKAFDTKALDDFVLQFRDKRTRIVQEYAQLKADLAGVDTSKATGGDVAFELLQGRQALGRGDAGGAEASASRVKSMLKNLRANGGIMDEVTYYSREAESFELAIVDAQEKAAVSARDALKTNLEQAAQEVAAMEPVAVPLATEAIANDLRATIEVIRQELQANPLAIPVVATRASGLYDNTARASLKLGAR